jgi:hypothetical protein
VKQHSGRPPGLPFALALVALGTAIAPAQAAPDPRALFARERAAVGGNAWASVAGIRTAGFITQAGADNPFTQILDHRSGWTKTTTHVGPLTDVSGYDGVSWDFQGGPVTEQTLPGLVADNRTQAYIARDGWWNPADPARMVALGANAGDDGVRVTPAGGSAVDVWFDRRTGLIDREVAHTDTGDSVTTDSDYRAVGDVVLSFRSVTVDPTNSTTVETSRSVELLRSVAAAQLARPAPVINGTLAGNRPSTIPFRLSDDPGAIIVAPKFGGRTAVVIFDSGGANYLIPTAAKRLGLKSGGGLDIGGVGNGSTAAGIAQVGTIALGGAVLHNQQAIVAALPYAINHESSKIDVEGLVGAEFLNAFRIRVDFVGRRMTLSTFGGAAPAGVVLPFVSDGAHAYVRATIDGVPGLYLLDTGDDGGITVFDRFVSAHRLPLRNGVRYLSVGGVGGHLAFDMYRAGSFTLAGATMPNPIVTVARASAGSFASRSVAGNIGLEVLYRYTLTFDFQRHVVAFVPNRYATLPFPADRSGLSLDQPDASAFVVLSIVPGGPAAQAGLAVGDRIVAVAGRNVAAARLGLDDLRGLRRGTKPYTVTIANGATQRTVTISPRALVPATP